jgi:prepilin-type processing-associated H-X9-DG protein
MASALQMYADDADGFLPDSRNWERGLLFALRVRPPFLCPATANVDPVVWQRRDDLIVGYAYNSYLSGLVVPAWQPRHSLHEAQVRWLTSTVAFCDARIQISTLSDTDIGEHVGRHWRGPSEEGGRRHRGGANYAFLDGHVKWYRPEAVDGSHKNEEPDGSRPSFRPF